MEALRDLKQALEEMRGRGVNHHELISIQGPAASNLTQTLAHYFQQHDADGSGTLHLTELVGLLTRGMQPPPTRNGAPLSEQDCVQIMRDFDQDGDDELSLEELLAVFVSSGPVQPAAEPANLANKGEPFVDGEFPPDARSLGQTQAFPANRAQWVRGEDLAPGDFRLFDNIEPNDISQGYLGDCWLLAAMASAAEFSGFVQSLFLTKNIPHGDELGRYRLKLFDGEAWQEIVVDDQIPTIQGKPAFSKPAGNELWAMLLEKAVAKLCGTYAATEGGIWNAGWLMFTGCTDQWSFKNPNGLNGSWTKTTMKFNPKTHAGRPLGGEAPEAQLGCDEMWQSLQQWDQDNFLMGAGTFKQGRMSGRTGHSGGESVRADGLVKGHAYSLLQCVEVDADGQHWRMVQLRNPWGPSQPGGESTEWNGRFSDGDAAWDEQPQLRRALGFEEKDDGIFWMTWEDFVDSFDGIYVSGAPVSVPKRTALRKLGVAAYEGAMHHFDRLNPLKKLPDAVDHLNPNALTQLGKATKEAAATRRLRDVALDVSTNASDEEPADEVAPPTPESGSAGDGSMPPKPAAGVAPGSLAYRTVWVADGAERPVVTLPPQYITPVPAETASEAHAPGADAPRALAYRTVWVEEGAERPPVTLPPQYVAPTTVLGYRCPTCKARHADPKEALAHCKAPTVEKAAPKSREKVADTQPKVLGHCCPKCQALQPGAQNALMHCAQGAVALPFEQGPAPRAREEKQEAETGTLAEESAQAEHETAPAPAPAPEAPLAPASEEQKEAESGSLAEDAAAQAEHETEPPAPEAKPEAVLAPEVPAREPVKVFEDTTPAPVKKHKKGRCC